MFTLCYENRNKSVVIFFDKNGLHQNCYCYVAAIATATATRVALEREREWEIFLKYSYPYVLMLVLMFVEESPPWLPLMVARLSSCYYQPTAVFVTYRTVTAKIKTITKLKFAKPSSVLSLHSVAAVDFDVVFFIVVGTLLIVGGGGESWIDCFIVIIRLRLTWLSRLD